MLGANAEINPAKKRSYFLEKSIYVTRCDEAHNFSFKCDVDKVKVLMSLTEEKHCWTFQTNSDP